jgi:hypothetical protein
LSHHLVMDEATWTFFEQLFSMLDRHPASRLCSAPYLFASSSLSNGHAA